MSEREDDDLRDESEDPTTEIFACPQCGADFDIESDLTLHRSQAHGIVVKPVSFSCPICDVQFPTRPQMEEHGRQQHPGL